jgi:arylsulfatase A-like enzyme
LGVAALVWAAVVTHGCAREEPARRIILIVLDAARADRVGWSDTVTPNLDEIGRRGVVFQNHFSQDTSTRNSIPKLLYSRYFCPLLFPDSAKVPLSFPAELFQTFDDESVSLPRALALGGYRGALVSAHSWFKPGSGIAAEFDESFDLSTELTIAAKYAYPRAQQVVDFAIEWLEGHRDEKYFLYLHLMDTHFPHFFEEDAQELLGPEAYERADLTRFADGGRPLVLMDKLAEPDGLYLESLYDGSLRYADRQLGRLFEYLRSQDQLEETLIVVTSDHGEHLLEVAGRFEHGGPWYEAVARVPLIVFYPPVIEPREVTHFTESVDVMPTILGLADVTLPAGKRLDGVDLTDLLTGRQEPRTHVFGTFGIRGPRFKALFTREVFGDLTEGLERSVWSGGEPDVPELYDLRDDPLETTNIWGSNPTVVADLRDRYREAMLRPLRRYQRARASEPPTTAFAIAARHFATVPAVPLVESVDLSAASATAGSTLGWAQSRHWNGYFLLARQPAEPLVIEFPVPSGRYEVSFAIRGSALIEVDGRQPMELTARPLAARRLGPWVEVETESMAFGPIEVEDDRFFATLRPQSGEGPFVIRYVGFRPVGKGQQTGSENEELEKRLKALGYLD